MKLPNSNNSPKFLSNANPVTKKIQLKIQQESLNVAQPKRKHPQLGNNHRFKLCPTLKLYSSLSRNNQATKQASTPPHRHHNNKEPNHRNNCPANQSLPLHLSYCFSNASSDHEGAVLDQGPCLSLIFLVMFLLEYLLLYLDMGYF